MQQLDDLEVWKVPQEPLSEEPMKDVEEKGAQSPESPEEVDGPAVLSPEGRSGAKPILKLAPARPTSANVEENLRNGEMPDGHLFGNECSPEDAKAEVILVAAEKEDHRPHQGGSEAASAADPAGQSLDPGQAPTSRQRKLAMEERVIRDHLGQEVGCMDAVGQNQSSLEKEEESEGHADSEGRGDRGSQPGPLDGVPDPKEALGEGPPDHALGSRDGPEGESPTAQDPPSLSGTPQNENGYPKEQGDGPPEGGSLAQEAGGRGVGQEEVPTQGAQEMEPALAPATGHAPTRRESAHQSPGGPMKTPEGQESGAIEARQRPERPGSQLEQLTASLPHQFPPVQDMKDLSSQEEAKTPLLDPVLPSSPTQIRVIPQDAIPSPQGTKESFLGQVPFQGNEGSLPDPEVSVLSNQSPLPPLDQNSSFPESKGSLLDQTPSAVQECLSEENPPSLPDPLPSSLERKPPSSQGVAPLLPDAERSATDQVTPSLQAADGALSSRSQTLPGTQTASLCHRPISPLPEEEPLAPQRMPSSWHEMEKPTAPQGQELLGQEVEARSRPDTIHSLSEQLSPLLDPTVSLLDTERSALEEPPVGLQDQMPTPPELHVSPLPEADVSLPSQIPPSVEDPCESPIDLLDQIPPGLQGLDSTSLLGKTPASSLQEVEGALPDEIQAAPPSHTLPHVPEEEGSSPDQAPPTSEDQTTTSLLGQTPSFQEAAKPLPEGQNSSDPPAESAHLAEHPSPPDKAPNPVLRDTPLCPNALPLSIQETLQPLLDKSKAAENQDATGSGNPSVASAGAGEVPEVLGNLHAEKQPLLKEAEEGSGAVSAGDPPSKAGILKPQGAASKQTPNNSSPRSSANTAHLLQAAPPHQGQEPEKGKRQSCQCCMLM